MSLIIALLFIIDLMVLDLSLFSSFSKSLLLALDFLKIHVYIQVQQTFPSTLLRKV